ncbi:MULTISPECIES: sensor histidine kinase [unclassified Paraburkholderia]|uniref:sensor histidine kinase n=1 Tax=unclassified Paraburkholderia TaxID=2615204 RepID=UPI002AB1D186|nr:MULTISPECIES: ATP-binding protein [unclassified Paraburkholderia]
MGGFGQRATRAFRKAMVSLLLIAATCATAAHTPAPARAVMLTHAAASRPAAFVQIKGISNQRETSFAQGVEVLLDSLDGFRFGADALTPAFRISMTKYANHAVHQIEYPKSIFREYRSVVLIILVVLLAQTLTIVALLVQRRNCRAAQAEAIARRGELARAARFATVGELSASIAHEVGQPLGAILSNADAAELLVKVSQLDSGELGDILSDVKRDALRANDVVQRLRSLLQKQGVVFSPIVFDSTLQCALTLIAPEAKRRNIGLETSFGAGDASIMGDAVQIQQIVLNLTINGMDAMQETAQSNRVLTLVTRSMAEGVEFTVTDRGCGLGAASSQRVFEPFYSTKPHGMGLGLSIVRSIVDAHHGDIKAVPRDGGGTTFVVWLPLVSDAVDAAKSGALRPAHIRPRGGPDAGNIVVTPAIAPKGKALP